ncbi:hypothetical protein QBC37DRAFT_284483 [Rhypophila decipiens]|uniref:Carbohydrate-binding module family 19 domain-containing protein n=1 Tax=Rhypophila decipiens TaxID=261697 RepID=A0AAN6YA13_9PEZI|nr:hypothetical protein QBC37DRAFT_284483 [Rhypophila decipiens]
MTGHSIFITASIAAGILSQLASGHIVMNTPTSFNLNSGSPLLQVGPLGDANPFPCHGATTVNSVTTLTAGSSTPVSFTGLAVHGGGSCQFSITYDYPGSATDPAKWKAIYTLIGGCPASAAGNLPAGSPDPDGRADGPHCGNDSGTECMRTFQVPIPKGLKNGNATFSWSWFNKMGNREMYQNCAPVTITGGTEDSAFYDALPAMFAANIPGQCTTGPEGVLNIPNPGKYGKVLEQPHAGTEGSCAQAGGIPTFEVGNDNNNESNTGGPFVSTSTLDIPSAANTTPASPSPSSAGSASAPPQTPETAADSPSKVNTENTTSCSAEGAIVCTGTQYYGVCDHGVAIPQLLAPGTVCSSGVITKRK